MKRVLLSTVALATLCAATPAQLASVPVLTVTGVSITGNGPIAELGGDSGALAGVSAGDFWTSSAADWLYCGIAITGVVFLWDDIFAGNRFAGTAEPPHVDVTPEPTGYVVLGFIATANALALFGRRRPPANRPKIVV